MKFCKSHRLLHVLPRPERRIVWFWQGKNNTVFRIPEINSPDDCLVELVNVSVPAITILVAIFAILKYKCSKRPKIREDLLPSHSARTSLCIFVSLILITEFCESLLTTTSLSSILTFFASLTFWILHRQAEIKGNFGTTLFTAGGFAVISLSRAWKLLYLHRYDLSLRHVRFATTAVIVVTFGILAILDLCSFYRMKWRKKRKIVIRQKGKSKASYKHSSASFLSRITFHWVTGLLIRGYNAPLQFQDLGELPEEETARCQLEKFQGICKKQKAARGKLQLWKCFWKRVWLPFALGGLLKLLGDALTLVGPMAISRIINYVSISQNETTKNHTFRTAMTFSEILENGYFLGVIIFFAALLQSTLSQASTHILSVEGIRLRTALQALFYDKALRLCSWNITEEERPLDKENQHRYSQFSDIGTLTNLASEDAYNVMSFFWIGHYIWAIPLKISAIVFLLYQKLGISAIIGVFCCISIVTPMQLLLGKKMSENCKSVAEKSDARLRLLNEILQGMRLVKLRAWEDIFEGRIKKTRDEELKLLDNDSIYWALINFLTHASSVFTALFTFGIYFWLEERNLEVGSVFASLALFSHLMVPLLIFPVMIPIVINAMISTRRMEDFLELPEIVNILPDSPKIAENSENLPSSSVDDTVKATKVYSSGRLAFFENIEEHEEDQRCSKKEKLEMVKDKAKILRMKSCIFSWGTEENQLLIDNLSFPRGQLTLITGKTGSGKSSLLLAILGEIQKTSGTIEWTKGLKIAYVAQKSWLQNATLRDNILFGSVYKPRKYRNVLRACALQSDIELLPDRDSTWIGEKGINLSGGQKQRVTIARALYGEADVIIMDDPLSALDQNVAEQIFEQAIRKYLLKSGRTVIMVTHKLELLSSAHQIIVMDNRQVRATGTKTTIENSDSELAAEWKRISARKTDEFHNSKTVQDRWSLIRLVSKVGINLRRKRDHDTHANPPPFIPLRMRRTTLSGSRYLAHDLTDLPVPVEEWKVTKKPFKSPFNARSLSLPSGGRPRIFRWNSIPTILENRYIPLRKRDPASEDGRSGSFMRRIFRSRILQARPEEAELNIEEGEERKTFSNNCRRVKLYQNQKHRRSVKQFAAEVQKTEVDDEEKNNNARRYQESVYENKAGVVTRMICTNYLKTGGWIPGLTYIAAAIVCQVLRTYTDFWLSRWTSCDNQSFISGRENIVFYFNVYIILSASSILLSFVYNAAGQWAGAKARRKFHEVGISNLFKVPISFFERNPVGQILNRFSADIGVIDKKISTSIQRLTSFGLLCCSAMIVNIIISPWYLIAVIPTCAIYYLIQRFYRRSAGDLQRLDGSTRGPIATHFSETLVGLSTLRASKQENRFMEETMERLNSNTNAFLILNTSGRWLGIALDYLGAVILTTAIFTAIISAEFYPKHVTPALVGLAINYTLLVPIYLNWVVKIVAEIEVYMGSVSRITSYKDAPTEDYQNDSKVREHWPNAGEIIFENVSLRHDSQNEPVISNLSLKIPPGQKLGICGRTGSGKSSTVMALFRLIEINQGRVLIDGIDVRKIPLRILRSRLSAIPQDVIMFSGTIRENLDPLSEYKDEELWNALELAQVKDVVSSHPEGLDFEVREGGENFSSGQLQLLCMARAILRKSPIVVFDEATSALDATTEKSLLKAIGMAFENKTVITIAHRTAALLHCDRVIVFDEGKIVEEGSPMILMQRQTGFFASMLKSIEDEEENGDRMEK